jgi:lysophospholipase L1-like esterase
MVDNRNYFWTKRADSQNAIVFVGDSLTGNWGNVAKFFPKYTVVNRGIGGDVTRGVLFRLKEDVLDLHPKAIVVNIGSNDLSAKEMTSDALANLSDILDKVHNEAPSVPVILCTLPPRDSKEAPIDQNELKDLNAGIAKLAQGKPNVTLLDLFPLLALPDGMPDTQNFKKDKLHLDTPGYTKWAAALEPIFEKLKLANAGN